MTMRTWLLAAGLAVPLAAHASGSLNGGSLGTGAQGAVDQTARNAAAAAMAAAQANAGGAAGLTPKTPTLPYTFVQSDCNTVLIRDTGTSPHQDTVPSGLPVGCVLRVLAVGVGLPSFAGSGVQIEAPANSPAAISQQFGQVTITIDTPSTAAIK